MRVSPILVGRRVVMDCLSWELARCRRYRGITSILLLGLDLPPGISSGMASWCVIQTGKLVRRAIREADLAGPRGNSEFLVLLPETPRGGALVAAERLRHTVEREAMLAGSGQVPITASIVVVSYPEDGDTVELIIAAADGALAEARALGGNRVQLAHGSTQTTRANSDPALG